MIMQSRNPHLCVSIYPKGSMAQQAYVIFENLEEKEAYIKEEARYTKTDYDSYLTKVGKAREEAREKALASRVKFAVKKGYGPSKANRSLWVKQNEIPDQPKLKPVA